MQHVINIQQLKNSGRPIGMVADSKLEAFLTEAEMLMVKPVIGDELYLTLCEGNLDAKCTKLMEGGTYNDKSGNRVYFVGLQTAISYYVYAKNVLCGDAESTRYGMVVKDDEYSTRLSAKERSDIYHDTMDIAQRYMNDCRMYISIVIKADKNVKRPQQNSGLRIRRIG